MPSDQLSPGVGATESLRMAPDDRAIARAPGELELPFLVGLEPLGSDVLVEGELRALSVDEIVVATASMLAAGTRAFVIIDDPGRLPVVGLVEIVEQQVVVDDVTVELTARFVRVSDANRDRLTGLFNAGLDNAARNSSSEWSEAHTE